MSEEVKAAAHRLKEWAFGASHDEGAVAVSKDCLYVYVWDDWHNETPTTWEGYPVTWKTNTGRPAPQAS